MLYLVLGIEPKAFCMLGKHSAHWTTSSSPPPPSLNKPQAFIYLFLCLFTYLFWCVGICMCACKGTYGEFRGQPVGVDFLLLGESWGLNWVRFGSRCLYPLSWQPLTYFFNMMSDINPIPFLCFLWLSNKSWKTVFQIMSLLKKQFFFFCYCWSYGLRCTSG